jgi:UDP-4-amino-4,6-dideoxy-L-N-acetyl-beta-L-altrosamine transaminase
MANYIPYGKQYIDSDDVNAVSSTLKSKFLTTGPKVNEFEQKICEFTGAKYAVAVCNGTAALHLASLVMLKPGEYVLTTPNSFLATSNSILYANAKPIFVDISSDGNIDLDICEQELKKNKKIKALYCVHFSGNPINQDKLSKLREVYDIKILEDCSHSIGATYTDSQGVTIRAGSCYHADVATFSFHPVKHITTGEGGAITTNSRELYDQLLILRNHGMVHNKDKLLQKDMLFDEKGNKNPWYYEMHSLGFNYRITDIQCALGIGQFGKLNQFINRRKKLADTYADAFTGLDWLKPLCMNNNSSYHLYVLLFDFNKLSITRSELFDLLLKKNIGVQVHYIPINKQPYYGSLGYGKEITPVMDKYYEGCVSIPMYPKLTDEEQQYVIQSIMDLN